MRISWSPLAISKLSDIIDFISRDDQDAAIRLVDSIIEAVESLAQFPEHGRHVPEIKRNNIREILIKPYRIIHRLEKKRISILTVRHMREIPDQDLKNQ